MFDALNVPPEVKILHTDVGVYACDNRNGALACANTSRKGVAEWLAQHEYKYVIGSDGLWVRH